VLQLVESGGNRRGEAFVDCVKSSVPSLPPSDATGGEAEMGCVSTRIPSAASAE
jgi:hypothetical protein